MRVKLLRLSPRHPKIPFKLKEPPFPPAPPLLLSLLEPIGFPKSKNFLPKPKFLPAPLPPCPCPCPHKREGTVIKRYPQSNSRIEETGINNVRIFSNEKAILITSLKFGTNDPRSKSHSLTVTIFNIKKIWIGNVGS